MATKTASPLKAPSSFRPLPRRSSNAGRVAFGIGTACAGAFLALWMMLGGDERPADSADLLLEQMQAAGQGANVPAFHALGGQLRTVMGNGRINVIASDVPASQCVKVGWRLAKTGTVIVNGVLPQRLSAAKLTELCEGGATLTWVPN